MKDFYPPPIDWYLRKEFRISKREMTMRINDGIAKLDSDVPEFARYWTDVPPIKRDLFIANIVEEVFR